MMTMKNARSKIIYDDDIIIVIIIKVLPNA
jgi:hypothetical protein